MITVIEPKARRASPPGRATAIDPGEEHVLLTGIRWETYQALLADLGDRPIHLTYDRGSLEIMTLSSAHETYKTLLGRFVEILTLELRMPIRSGGSTTLDRKELQRGLESDECYYIQNEARVRGKLHIDLAVDPPPDLALEIDVTRSSVNRQAIYAALRVPELWRFDGDALHVYVLRPDGEYERSAQSRCFPFLPMGEVERFLKQITTLDETTLVGAFQDWVRQTLVPIVKKA
jgi:Uma2 family endonuclease